MKQLTKAMLDQRLFRFIRQWDADIEWPDEELAQLAIKLKQIAFLNRSRIFPDQPVVPEAYLAFFMDCIKASLGKVMRMYAASAGTWKPSGMYRAPDDRDTAKPYFKFLVPERYVPKLDINSADAQNLEAIPGIGQAIAKKIVAYRIKAGRIRNIEELVGIEGISGSMLDQFKHMITLGQNHDRVFFTCPELRNFVNNPSFHGYIKLIKQTRGTFFVKTQGVNAPVPMEEDFDVKKAIALELDKCLRILCHAPDRPRLYGTTSGMINEYGRARRIACMREENAAKDVIAAAVLDDTQYMFFLQKALAEAKSKIYIVMFFMRFEDEKKYPTDECIDLAVRAHKNGLDVKIILDRDAEGDAYNSRLINKEIYDHLEKNGVPVVFDAELHVTHSKIVIIDDSHAIVGSHNWTAGSFYAYDDKSLYVESRQFNAQMTERFQTLWEKCHNKIRISDLRTISAELKGKLQSMGFYYTNDVLDKLKTQKDRDALAKDLGTDRNRITGIANIFDLMRVDGMDEAMAYLLEKNGVDTVVELSKRTAESLYEKIKQYPIEPWEKPVLRHLPVLKHIAHWISKAKGMKRVLEYD